MKILEGMKVEIIKWARYPPTAKHIDFSRRTTWGTNCEGLSRAIILLQEIAGISTSKILIQYT